MAIEIVPNIPIATPEHTTENQRRECIKTLTSLVMDSEIRPAYQDPHQKIVATKMAQKIFELVDEVGNPEVVDAIVDKVNSDNTERYIFKPSIIAEE
jgi:hypothetical protein